MKVIFICGPTASGKTKYTIELAKKIDGEIVSCDSMQLYKYMNIGSAKPTEEEQKEIKHYLVDEIDPREKFSVARYQEMAKKAINEIDSKGKTPIVEGGTGLYLNSLIYNMDFSGGSFDNVSGENNKTNDYEVILIGLTRDREELYDRINKRVDIMVENGLFDEVKGLIDMGLTYDDISMKGIGYKEIISYFNGEYSKEEAIDKTKQNSRHFAKRQMTWFRRYSDMNWINISECKNDNEVIEKILWVLQKK